MFIKTIIRTILLIIIIFLINCSHSTNISNIQTNRNFATYSFPMAKEKVTKIIKQNLNTLKTSIEQQILLLHYGNKKRQLEALFALKRPRSYRVKATTSGPVSLLVFDVLYKGKLIQFKSSIPKLKRPKYIKMIARDISRVYFHENFLINQNFTFTRSDNQYIISYKIKQDMSIKFFFHGKYLYLTKKTCYKNSNKTYSVLFKDYTRINNHNVSLKRIYIEHLLKYKITARITNVRINKTLPLVLFKAGNS